MTGVIPVHKMEPVNKPIRGTVAPPGSKSITNRALILAALAQGTSHLSGVLDSEDTRVMIDSLRKLGLSIEQDFDQKTLTVIGSNGGQFSVSKADLWLQNSGTSIRFLTAAVTLGRGKFRLDGNERMRQRPISDQVDGLNILGSHVQCELGTDCPPVLVDANGLPGGETILPGDLSSQYLSAILMAAPCAQKTVTIRIEGVLVSRSYVEMTIACMKSFGVEVQQPDPQTFVIHPQKYIGRLYHIEPDASAASYFFAAAAITQGQITIQGLHRNSLQGDVKFVDVLQQMGCIVEFKEHSITVTGKPLTGVDVDMNDISDTAQTLAVVAPFAQGPTRVRNVAHMRHKETDRVAAVVTELKKAGIQAEEHADGYTIWPGPVTPASIATYDDHRMAMSFALLGLKYPGILIEHPDCTRKTFPDYFSVLEELVANS